MELSLFSMVDIGLAQSYVLLKIVLQKILRLVSQCFFFKVTPTCQDVYTSSLFNRSCSIVQMSSFKFDYLKLQYEFWYLLNIPLI